MSRELPFLIYCIERYKAQKNLSGANVVALFNEYNVMEYIYNFFESLHTMSDNNILADIDSYISDHKS